MAEFIGGIIFLVVFVIILRLLGSWMLRINEIIDLLHDIKKIELKRAENEGLMLSK